MKKQFKVEKLPLEDLLNLLIELYESGVDYIDLSTDNSNPHQDKLIIFTKEGYINPDYYDEERLNNFDIVEEEVIKNPSIIETKKLSDEDIDKLL